jgi:hypothetical protein
MWSPAAKIGPSLISAKWRPKHLLPQADANETPQCRSRMRKRESRLRQRDTAIRAFQQFRQEQEQERRTETDMAEITIETAIIGGGQAGVPLARALADAGRSVVLIKREHLGGSCVNFGMHPEKGDHCIGAVGSGCEAGGGTGHPHS